MMPLVSEPITWRRWAFEHAHNAYLNSHRTAMETYHVLKRMGYWDTMTADCDRWCAECETCLSHRGQTLHPPMRSVLADTGLSEVLPWHDVIVDMQGPFTKAESGEQYIRSYHCSRLKVPYLEVRRNL